MKTTDRHAGQSVEQGQAPLGAHNAPCRGFHYKQPVSQLPTLPPAPLLRRAAGLVQRHSAPPCPWPVGLLLLASAAVAPGCRSNPGLARRNQTEATPAAARQVAPDGKTSRTAADDLTIQPQSPESSAADSTDKPRKRFGSLFRRNREPDAVPLPTTPISDQSSPLGGPAEDFQ